MNRCKVKALIALAATGVFVGILAAAMFIPEFHNLNAGVWSIISGIFAGVTLWVHVQYFRGKLEAYHRSLRSLMLLGCIGQLAGICALVTYLSLGAVLRQGIAGKEIYGENCWIASVWGFMTWKWGFQLLWFSRAYKREFENSYLVKDGAMPRTFDSTGSLTEPVRA